MAVNYIGVPRQLVHDKKFTTIG